MVIKMSNEVRIRECLRCGHKWALRKPAYGEPATCPNCGSPRWNKPPIYKPRQKKDN